MHKKIKIKDLVKIIQKEHHCYNQVGKITNIEYGDLPLKNNIYFVELRVSTNITENYESTLIVSSAFKRNQIELASKKEFQISRLTFEYN